MRENFLPLRENFLPLKENFLTLRENFLPQKENFLPSRENFFPSRENFFVILGVTSSGTSNIGHCGGINNPTHYTRVKKITKWIKKYVHPEDICWAGKNAEPAPL